MSRHPGHCLPRRTRHTRQSRRGARGNDQTLQHHAGMIGAITAIKTQEFRDIFAMSSLTYRNLLGDFEFSFQLASAIFESVFYFVGFPLSTHEP